MLGNEVSNVVNDTCNGYKCAITIGTPCLEVVPRDDWQLGERSAPVKCDTPRIESFLLLLKTTLLNLIVSEPLEVVRESGFADEVNSPFRRIILVPGNCISYFSCQSMTSCNMTRI